MASPTNDVQGEGSPHESKVSAAEYDANVALLQFGHLMVSSAQPTVNSEPTGDPGAEQAARNEVCPSFSEEGAKIAGKEVKEREEVDLQARWVSVWHCGGL